MNAISVSNETSIVQLALLGRSNSTLRVAMQALESQAILFSRITPLVAEGDDIAALVRFGYQAASESVIDCREHANEGDILGVFDCLTRATSGHRTAKNVLSIIEEMANKDIADLARLGITLASSVLSDLGCDNAY